MEPEPEAQFDNTHIAFSYKSDSDLRRANFIFTVVNHPVISSVATGLVKIGLALRLPIRGIIRKTVFDHFCGGETIEESEKTIEQLGKYKVETILDYSVEGENSERGFDHTCEEILATFEEAKKSPHVPFCVFKATGMADGELLTKIQDLSANEKERVSNSSLASGSALSRGAAGLTSAEASAFEKVKARIDRICQKAFNFKIPVLIDAEETWLQDPIDQIACNMMRKYNGQRAIVFTTYQMYRTDSLANLATALADAVSNNYFLGVKIVRGAYMEKERERAEKMQYPDPIHPDKESTDDAFNKALEFCLHNISRVSLVCGSHNEFSNQYLTTLIKKQGLAHNDKRVWFSQLLGMSDNISFNLANAGYNVVKYVPFGPVKSVMPYLFRRAEENTSAAGQSSRELLLIRKEIQRRKKYEGQLIAR
jgi:proline dehydrogenase